MSARLARTVRRWTREVRPTWALAVPIIFGMVGQMLMGLADTIMVGRVGVVPLAASAFVNAIAHLPLVFSVGFLSAVSVLISQAYGAERPFEAGEALKHGLVVACVLGVLTVIASFSLRPFLGYFGQPPEVVAASSAYWILIGVSMLPLAIAHTCKLFGESLNRPWAPTLILLAGVLLNILLNWILIYGHWGATALGLEGAGWATLISRSASAIGLVSFALGSQKLRRYLPPRWSAGFQWVRFRQILALGWPVAAQHLLEVGAFAFAALMMGWIGSDALAAHQVAVTCASVTFMFPFGVGMAVCIRVGHVWGAGQYRRMRRIGFVGLAMGASIMACFGMAYILGGESLARVFVTDSDAIKLTVSLFFIAALFQVADGLQVVAISALRGLADVRVPALIAVFSYWFVAVPFGYVLAFPLRLGAIGIWVGLATGLGSAAIGLSWRFHLKSRLRQDAYSR